MKFKSILLALTVLMLPVTSTSLEVSSVYALGTSADWARPAVTAMNDAGLIPNSLKDDKDYKENISREEYAELITTYYSAVKKQTSLPSASESNFKDTNNPLILFANKLGIVGGYPDGTFKPQNNITRQEIAVMSNQAEKQLHNIGQTSNVGQFKDNKQIASWAKESVGSLATAGGIGGYPDKTFKPTNKMTKQEAISLVSNLAGKAGLIAKAPVVVAPPVTGQTTEQAQALYKSTMDGFNVTVGRDYPTAIDRVKSFRIVENGTPFEMNGINVTKVNLEETTPLGAAGTNMTITQEGTGKTVTAYADIYTTNGQYGLWKQAERGSTGHWWFNATDPNLVKAAIFGDGNYNIVMVKLK